MEREVSPIYHGKLSRTMHGIAPIKIGKGGVQRAPTILAGEKFVQKFVDDLRIAFALERFHRFAEEELAYFDFA